MFNDFGVSVAERTKMAKKKAARAVKQNTLVAYKGTEAFGEWLKRLAEHTGLPVTNTLDLALKCHAEKVGFTEPMPKRQVR
jgi:hypothetical protein